jgi:hypothetical protein
MGAQDRDFGLVIGIRHYPDYKSLDGAINDAEDFGKWLCESDGGGLDSKHVEYVLSLQTESDLRPVQEQIDFALSKLKKGSAGGGRRFYLYFAGHGMGSDTTELALCLPRWSPEWRRAALCLKGYLKYIVELGHFQQVACFLDCCRVRQVSIGCNPPQIGNVKPAENAGAVVTFEAYATEFENLAYEAEENQGGPVRGHFTRALLEALRGGAAGPGRGVMPSRLAGYVNRRTTELATGQGQNQKAYIPSVPADEANWIFGNYPAEHDVEISFKPERAGTVLLEDPFRREIRRGAAREGPWQLRLEAALHLLTDLTTSETKPFWVKPNGQVQHELF